MRKIERIFVYCTVSTAKEVITKFNALFADLKAKDYIEADTAE